MRHSAMNGLGEEGINEKVGKSRVAIECLSDVAQKDTANNTATAPHEGTSTIVQVPFVLLSCFTKFHESLCIRNNLGRIDSVANIF